eukprot:TRINITY_DN43616_c0_g1_i1.p1 TRINITY_DN43616_c0_g1~~TRINITY_DN43616_c0_g1_i1.p1  ORF type:complete len:379 (-),score=43.69 TRINITY_DN43616_c0_g1_i1:172-1173(-)
MTFGELHQQACDVMGIQMPWHTLKLFCAERTFDTDTDWNSSLEQLGVDENTKFQAYKEVLPSVKGQPLTYSMTKLTDGTRHYHDRGYSIYNVPQEYKDMDLFQGPCHHGRGDRISLEGPADALVCMMVNSGNEEHELRAFGDLMVSDGWKDEAWTDMWTESFDRPNRYRVYSKRLGEGIKLAVNTHIELNIAAKSPSGAPSVSISSERIYPIVKCEEGIVQFSDRDYHLFDVPETLIGGDLFQGPCHHNAEEELTVSGPQGSTVYMLIASGNEGIEKAQMERLLKDWEQTECNMRTESFGGRGFRMYSKPLSDGVLTVKLNTHIELSIVLKHG